MVQWLSGKLCLAFPQSISAHLLPYGTGIFSIKLKQINRKPTGNIFSYSPTLFIIKFSIPRFTVLWRRAWWRSDFMLNDQHQWLSRSLLLALVLSLLLLSCSVVVE